MKKGERVELVVPGREEGVEVRFLREDTDGFVVVTSELEYEYATLRDRDPEPLVRVHRDEIRPLGNST